jgi:hypothetical protein
LFDKIKPNNQITIGYKKLTALPENGGARVFKGVSDKQVMAYFKQLTFISRFLLFPKVPLFISIVHLSLDIPLAFECE